jgi:hypothetical protein
VAAAARLGLSYGKFMGWPHEERELMIAHFRIERNTGRYGEWLPDAIGDGSTSDRANPNNYDDPLRYVAEPLTNWAEKAARDQEDADRKRAGADANLNGMFYVVREA